MTDKSTPAIPLTDADFDRIAASIRTAHEMGKRLKACGLTERAVVLLLQDYTNVSQRDCKLVLHGLANLHYYLETKRG